MEEEQEFRERLKSGQAIPITPPPLSPLSQHRLWPEVGVWFYLPLIFFRKKMWFFLGG